MCIFPKTYYTVKKQTKKPPKTDAGIDRFANTLHLQKCFMVIKKSTAISDWGSSPPCRSNSLFSKLTYIVSTSIWYLDTNSESTGPAQHFNTYCQTRPLLNVNCIIAIMQCAGVEVPVSVIFLIISGCPWITYLLFFCFFFKSNTIVDFLDSIIW